MRPLIIPKTIQLPRKDKDGRYYISYTQHSKWHISKRDYIRAYFFGEPFRGNVYMSFGKKVATAIEKEDYSEFTGAEIETLSKATRLDIFERRVELDFGPFFVLCYIDTATADLSKLIDHKTGELDKVSYYKDDFYDQLPIYAAACEQETGFYPEEAYVELIERKGNPFKGEPLTIGKEIVRIEKDISPGRVHKACEDILKTALDINQYFRVLRKLKTIKF